MDAVEILSATTFFLMLPLLSAGLFIAYMHKRNYMEDTGFGKPEVGMILVGSMFGIFTDIPLIVSGSALLNINLGGALIPIIVSGSLIYRKKLNLLKLSAGVILVSIISYHLTRFEPEMGIVAEFPYYFIPSLIAIALALVLELKGSNRIPYAYSTAVLGVLIGADLVRIPMLVDASVMGSIGGAGAMDLVYLSGLIAAMPLVVYYYFRNPLSKAEDSLDESLKMLRLGRYRESIEFSISSVRDELGKVSRLMRRPSYWANHELTDQETFRLLGTHPLLVDDYYKLYDARYNPSGFSAHKAFFTATLLKKKIADRVNERFSSLLRRISAYFIDLLIVTTPIIVAIFFFYMSNTFFSNLEESPQISPLFFALISLLISVQFIYFTIMEWYFGTTIGKKLLGLKVLSDDYNKISFTQSAARNSARYADIALFFYVFSLVLIVSNPERKRIGDYIGGTRVVKTI